MLGTVKKFFDNLTCFLSETTEIAKTEISIVQNQILPGSNPSESALDKTVDLIFIYVLIVKNLNS
jgi:hypothetical protein